MSAGRPIPYGEALPIAEELCDLLAPACERIVIAGSLRRRKPHVADIELVAEPSFRDEPQGLWSDMTTRIDLLAKMLASLRQDGTLGLRPVVLHRANGTEETSTRDGRSYKALVYLNIPVDLFIVHPDEADWGVIVAIRTGPAEFSHRLVTECQSYGRQVKNGHLYVHGARVPCPTEEDFFRQIGQPWLDPWDRHDRSVRLRWGEAQ